MEQELFGAAAAAVLLLHLIWLLFVIFGALVTRGRPVLTAIHIAALAWGLTVELGARPCPLTALEQHLQARAGMDAYTQSFLAHYLDRLVYPGIPLEFLVAGAVSVCVFNLAIYFRRLWRSVHANAATSQA